MKKEIAKAVLNEPEFLFTVTENVKVNKKKWGIIPVVVVEDVTHDVFITGATASTLLKVAGLIEGLKVKSDKTSEMGQMYDLINSNLADLVDFLAIVIHNKSTPPPIYLKSALMHDFDMDQLQSIAQRVYGRLGVEGFFGIMGLVHEFKIVADPKIPQEAKVHGV